MSPDRFGNPIDPSVGYARGSVLRSSADEVRRLRHAPASAAAMAARTGDRRLLHTPEAEARLLEVMVHKGLINSTHGIIDPNVDGIAKDSHVAVAELCRSIVEPAFAP